MNGKIITTFLKIGNNFSEVKWLAYDLPHHFNLSIGPLNAEVPAVSADYNSYAQNNLQPPDEPQQIKQI